MLEKPSLDTMLFASYNQDMKKIVNLVSKEDKKPKKSLTDSKNIKKFKAKKTPKIKSIIFFDQHRP